MPARAVLLCALAALSALARAERSPLIVAHSADPGLDVHPADTQPAAQEAEPASRPDGGDGSLDHSSEESLRAKAATWAGVPLNGTRSAAQEAVLASRSDDVGGGLDHSSREESWRTAQPATRAAGRRRIEDHNVEPSVLGEIGGGRDSLEDWRIQAATQAASRRDIAEHYVEPSTMLSAEELAEKRQKEIYDRIQVRMSEIRRVGEERNLSEMEIEGFWNQLEREIMQNESDEIQREGACSHAFRKQTLQDVVVSRGAIRVPPGVALGIDPVSGELEAHRCPNPSACPGAALEVDYDQNSHPEWGCRLGVRQHFECAPGYTTPWQGCGRCAEGFGRRASDPFLCKDCGSSRVAIQFAGWLARPALMFTLSAHSAAKAAATATSTAARERELMKILVSYCANSALLGSILVAVPFMQDLSDRAKDWLRFVTRATEEGSPSTTSSIDCLLGQAGVTGEAKPWQVAAASLAMPTIILIGALVFSMIRKAVIGIPLRSTMLLCLVIAGSQFIPAIAGTTAQGFPTFHTQKNDVVMRMSYAPWEPGTSQFHELLGLAPFFLTALAAGPALWLTILRFGAREGSSGKAIAFLASSYKAECAGWWEAFRLMKNMMLSFVCTASPMSYSPSALLAQVGIILIAYGGVLCCCQPYSEFMLNVAEGIALGVTLLVVMTASFLLARSWSITPFAEVALISVSAVAMLGTFVMLAFLYLSEKYRKQHPGAGQGPEEVRASGHEDRPWTVQQEPEEGDDRQAEGSSARPAEEKAQPIGS